MPLDPLQREIKEMHLMLHALRLLPPASCLFMSIPSFPAALTFIHKNFLKSSGYTVVNLLNELNPQRICKTFLPLNDCLAYGSVFLSNS